MPLKRLKDKLVKRTAKALRRESFFAPVTHSRVVAALIRHRLRSGKPLPPTVRKLLRASATGPAVYATAATAAGAAALKKSMDKKAYALDSFFDELDKIEVLDAKVR